MIIYENGKIVAISKNLLNLLNISLEEISTIINKLQLETALLNQKSIEILNFKFNVKKEELITLKNIDIYLLKLAEKKETLETIQSEEKKPLSVETQTLNVSPKETEPLKTTELNINEEEKPIELSFEDNISECEKIFKQKNKINEIIKEELKIATEELGIDETLANDLFKDLLKQIEKEKNNLLKAIENQDYKQIHKIAHFLKGASLNLRLSNLAFIFKTIDEEAKNKSDITVIKNIVNQLYDYISPLQTEKKQKNKITIDPKIKSFVFNTIRYYLETQDEKKFQKDKQYLEKLLNTKINSLNDLEEIIKES
jgi:HPt (histidine-containing phosphotransfer) domain-containing protein